MDLRGLFEKLCTLLHCTSDKSRNQRKDAKKSGKDAKRAMCYERKKGDSAIWNKRKITLLAVKNKYQ